MESEQASAVVHISWVDGTYTVNAKTEGSSEDAARKLAERILGLLAEGRFAFIRAEPDANTDVIHNTQERLHHGYVRFSFREEPGSWERAAVDHLPVHHVGFSALSTAKNS